MADFEEKVKAAFDAEFDRARPRPGLRGRVIANAVATSRVRRRGFGAWLTPPRLAAAGAAAAVLVVAAVGLRFATQGPPTAIKPTPTASVLAFGKLPAPALHPAVGLGAGGGPQETAVPYFGPATMTWSGRLPTVPSSAPVYRFNLPTAADADAFAARLGGTLVSSGSPNEPKTYRLPGGWLMSIRFNDPVAGEPVFYINRQAPSSGTQPLGEDKARAVADAELTRFGLTPSWKFRVLVTTLPPLVHQGPNYLIQYQRLVDFSADVTAGEVDGNGDPAGIQVIVDSSGKALQVTGIFRLTEERGSYPLRAPTSIVSDAVNAPPSIPQPGPVPTVVLTKVTLVYTVVASGTVGYLEPAYLFTGTFTEKGTTLEKRVLVPAIAPSASSTQ